MPAKIPDLEYINDAVDGAIYAMPDGALLVIGTTIPDAVPDATLIARGAFVVRYAIPLIVPPTDAIIPGLFFGERGGGLVGREGWDYLQEHFQVHPRADVVGLKLDGSRGQYWVRELDFGVPVRVFAFAAPGEVKPLAELHAYRADPSVAVPELLARYLPRAT